MKKEVLFFILLIFNITPITYSQGTWTQKAEYGGGIKYSSVSFSIGNKGYIGPGNKSTGTTPFYYKKDLWEYDPIADTWTQKANFPGPARYGAVGFSIGKKGYVGTGSDDYGNHMQDFWAWNQKSNIWKQIADASPRCYAVGFSIKNKGYIGTGIGGRGTGPLGVNLNDFWEYDTILNQWSPKADFPGGVRYYATGFSIDTKGYIGTGSTGSISGLCYKDFWEYDPSMDKWTQKADFGGGPRVFAIGFSILNHGFMGTGYDEVDFYSDLNDFWQYDPPLDKWTKKADLTGVRFAAAGFAIGCKGYIGTGMSFNPQAYEEDFWEYSDPLLCGQLPPKPGFKINKETI